MVQPPISSRVLAVAAALLLAGCGGGRDEARPGGERPVPVVVQPAQRIELTRTLESVGTLVAAQSVVVTAEDAGRVAAVRFRNGERVEAGEVLVELERGEQAADAAALRAEAAELRQQLARQESLLPSGAVARSAVEDFRRRVQAAEARAAAARTRLRDAVVRAPFAGTVGLSRIAVGAYVAPGDAIAPLDDASSLTVTATLPERELGRIAVGAGVEGRTPAYPDRVFRGELTALDSRVDPEQRTLAVEARLPNPDGALRPGMLMNVRIAAETVADAVVVPPLAVQVQGDTHYVYRIADGCAERVEVRIGERRPRQIEVLAGLQPGDVVAVEGLQKLSSGAPVTTRGSQPQTAAASRTGAVALDAGAAPADADAEPADAAVRCRQPAGGTREAGANAAPPGRG